MLKWQEHNLSKECLSKYSNKIQLNKNVDKILPEKYLVLKYNKWEITEVCRQVYQLKNKNEK